MDITIQDAFMVSFVINAIFLVLFVVLYFFTGSLIRTWMTARIKHQPILCLIRADNEAELRAVTFEAGIYSDKKYGDFIVNKEAVIRWPHGITGMIAIDREGAGIPPGLAVDLQTLKNGGVDDITQLEEKIRGPAKIIYLGAKGPEEIVGKVTDFGESIYVESPSGNAQIRKENIKGVISSDTGMKELKQKFPTVDFQSLKTFFKYNINPNYIQSRVERKTARNLREMRSFPWRMILIILFIVMGIVALYYLLNSPQAPLKPMADAIGGAGKNVVDSVSSGAGGVGIK